MGGMGEEGGYQSSWGNSQDKLTVLTKNPKALWLKVTEAEFLF